MSDYYGLEGLSGSYDPLFHERRNYRNGWPVNWTEILRKGGVKEPPGYQETVRSCREEPYVAPKKKGGKKGGKR